MPGYILLPITKVGVEFTPRRRPSARLALMRFWYFRASKQLCHLATSRPTSLTFTDRGFCLVATYPSAATPTSAMRPSTQTNAFGRVDARPSLTVFLGGRFLSLDCWLLGGIARNRFRER